MTAKIKSKMKAAKGLLVTCGQRSRQSRLEREEDFEQQRQRNKNKQHLEAVLEDTVQTSDENGTDYDIISEVENILGSDYKQKIRSVKGVLAAMSKILDVFPWDPANIDEKVVQMLLHVLLSAQSEEFDLSFFEIISDAVGGPNWIANEKAGYGKTFVRTDKNIKAGLYRWNKNCIAGIHDHGKETVAFYAAVGKNSYLLNKVYEKKPTDTNEANIEKEYDEILDGSSSNPVSILRPRHAHAIHNLSDGCSYTIHIYVPSYEFGLAWDYENRESVNVIRQSLIKSREDKESGTFTYISSLQNENFGKLSVRQSMVQDG